MLTSHDTDLENVTRTIVFEDKDNTGSESLLKLNYKLPQDKFISFKDISIFQFRLGNNTNISDWKYSLKFTDNFANTRLFNGNNLPLHGNFRKDTLVPIIGYRDTNSEGNDIPPGVFVENSTNEIELIYDITWSDTVHEMVVGPIAAVPEPFSTISLIGGIVGFIRKRK